MFWGRAATAGLGTSKGPHPDADEDEHIDPVCRDCERAPGPRQPQRRLEQSTPVAWSTKTCFSQREESTGEEQIRGNAEGRGGSLYSRVGGQGEQQG